MYCTKRTARWCVRGRSPFVRRMDNPIHSNFLSNRALINLNHFVVSCKITGHQFRYCRDMMMSDAALPACSTKFVQELRIAHSSCESRNIRTGASSVAFIKYSQNIQASSWPRCVCLLCLIVSLSQPNLSSSHIFCFSFVSSGGGGGGDGRGGRLNFSQVLITPTPQLLSSYFERWHFWHGVFKIVSDCSTTRERTGKAELSHSQTLRNAANIGEAGDYDADSR